MIRIVNTSGQPMMTRVFDAATGEDLTSKLVVSRIVIDVERREITATLVCRDPQFDIVSAIESITIIPERGPTDG